MAGRDLAGHVNRVAGPDRLVVGAARNRRTVGLDRLELHGPLLAARSAEDGTRSRRLRPDERQAVVLDLPGCPQLRLALDSARGWPGRSVHSGRNRQGRGDRVDVADGDARQLDGPEKLRRHGITLFADL